MNPNSLISAGVARASTLANQIASLPAVQQLVRAEELRQLEAGRQARQDCIARLREAEQAESQAVPAFDSAVAALRIAEAEVEARQREVFVAQDVLSQARQRVASVSGHLVREHGEGAIMLGLGRLQQMIGNADTALGILKENSKEQTPWGTWRTRPHALFLMEIEKEKRSKAVAALAEMEQLVMADLAPVEITAKVDQLLSSAGLGAKPDRIDTPSA